MKKIVFALIASAAVAGAAQAQTTNDAPRGYIGLGAATAGHDYSISGVTDNGGHKTSAKIFGGYEFDRTWGLEAGYTDFRKSGFNYTTANGTAGQGTSDGHATYLAAKANMPVNEKVSVFGKLGVQNSHRSFTTNTGLSGSSSETGAYGAAGLQYNLSKEVSLTAEYERYGKSKDFGAKADVWTVGARYNF
jgi:OOP family OmpA-OmpF porin